MQTVVTVTDVTWLFAKENSTLYSVKGKGKIRCAPVGSEV